MRHNPGETMKRIALLTLAALVAASPAVAATKKKAPKAPPPAAAKPDTRNEDSFRLVRDSLPVWLPTWSLPFYMKMRVGQEPPAAAPAKKTKRTASR
jgi:hypothetical protein